MKILAKFEDTLTKRAEKSKNFFGGSIFVSVVLPHRIG